MYTLDGDHLVKTDPKSTGLWHPEEPLEFFNPWFREWQPLQCVVYYGKHYVIDSVSTFDLTSIKVRLKHATNN